MVTGNISTGLLKDLLAFESEKYNIPFIVFFEDLNDYEDSLVIRKAVEVYIHTGTGLTKELTLKDARIVLKDVYIPYNANPSEDGIYGVVDNKVFIGFDIEAYTTEPWINSVFASIFDKIMPAIKHYLETEALQNWQQEYLKLKQFALKDQLRKMKSDIQSNTEAIQTKTDEIKEFTLKNYNLAQAIDSIEHIPNRVIQKKALSEFEALMKLTPDPVSHIELDTEDGRLTVFTSEIYIDYNNTTYDIGRFRIDIQLISSVINLTNTVKRVKGYHHPHISQDGNPCLGNIASTVYYLLIHQDIYQLVTLLIEFLKSYNEQNPYVDIEQWDPDYQDTDIIDQYESCFEDSSPYDCVICSDTNCPYHEDAQDRCHDARNNPVACMECSADCKYARDYEACFESQQQNQVPRCRTCQITDCPHNQYVRQIA